uniref:UDP-glucose ceramide glucosyltransferase-like 1 n=1 Tax=Sinocyclocheilus grahami TaxID=75366 RepID=A0A672T8Z5_SINGR
MDGGNHSGSSEFCRGNELPRCRLNGFIFSGFCGKMWMLCAALLALGSVHSVNGDSKAVTTTLTTKWPSTPLLLEASEFLAEESQDKFWDFVEATQNIENDHDGNICYESCLLLSFFRHAEACHPVCLFFFMTLLPFEIFLLDCLFILKVMLDDALERPKPYLFKGDHKFPSANPDAPVVILYAELGTKEFSRFHQLMLAKANKGLITYVLRHFLSNPSKSKVHLSGYGVELAIKNQEYKAKDDTQVQAGADVNATVIGENDPVDEVQGFLFGKLKTNYPELKEQLKELRKHLIESTNEMAPLKVWQMQDLSFQTAARILAAPSVDALNVMRDLSQNFPTKARSITKTVVNSEIRKEIEENQKYFKGTLGLQPGDSALFINGLHIDLDVQDIFSVFDVLRNEARVMEGLRSLLVDTPYIHDILKLNIQPSDSDYAVDIRSPAVNWINNLETDGRYASWPSNVQELLRPTFPGVIRQIRKNFHNLVMILDPTLENTAVLISVAEMFYSNNIPLRIGVVFVVNDSDEVDGMQDAGVALLRAFNYIADDIDSQMAFDMLNRVPSGGKLKVEHVVGVLEKRYPYVEISSILGPDSAYDNNRKEGKAYYEQTGVGPLPVVLYNGMPLQREQLDPDELETVVMHKILETTSFFQRTVYLGELNSDHDVVDFIMNQPNVVPRINSRILSTSRNYLDLAATNNHFIDEYARFLFLDTKDKNAAVANSMNYMTKKGMSTRDASDDGIIRPVTFWVVGDFDQPSGRQLLYDAIRHMKTSNNVRLGVINNPSENPSNEKSLIARAIWAAMQTQTANNAKNFITKMAKEETAQLSVRAGSFRCLYLDSCHFLFLCVPTQVLKQLVNVNLRVFMNCQSKLSDLPLKSFYRYVLEPEISFMADSSFAPGPLAKFLDMPQSLLFTLNLNTPESWMVESVHTRYDLDNIYLEEIDSVVAAEYELEYLLLEGHCFDVTTGQPPRGLQFTLGTASNPVIVDTIVMANLGYFQLKANPGAWILRLRKGRSDDIYKIYSHDGTDSPAEADDLIVVLNTFKSKIIKVKVQKKPDMMNEELLSDGTHENDSGFWTSLTRGFTGGSKPEEPKQEKEDVINIFSVASGHLYERFLRIMMLSVIKHTKTPVKFWFLKNYLSPTFKEFIPYMAEKYGFQYELVQYKWPRWLHQQTEKQRIIWGYKILFLDVLFPLAVDKILFVDADQIVRTDLKELRDFDLEGAPYGYTPFCESRREMDGYRFWKSGYWASHLAGRKYHISALYVVDLKKFRKIAAGDRLRGQYQGLSQDPNSLSNLDQDLPNNMIHQVPIKSLPQEWLWCETWCDDASKQKAKTIDLCNNPQTKEPKLQAAVRIVAEWSNYDQEIKGIYNNFLEEKERGTTDKKKSLSIESRAVGPERGSFTCRR